jgi:tRNA(Ile)-lysidine synthetase-like protein
LHALVQLNVPNLSIHAVHFDHKQRGSESDGDREFVEQLCKDLQIPLHTYFWDASSSSQQRQHAFSQDAARTWRRTTMYRLLLQTLTSDRDRGIIMTAHHRDDSTETLILKLLRGVHITNLVGMDLVSEPSDMPRAVWARPMLHLSKQDIAEFLTAQSISWREDATNASSKYKRNRVRNELIPLLAEIVGSQQLLEKRLDRLSLQSKEFGEDLRQRANQYLQESGSNQYFILPSSSPLSLVHRDALHLWSRQQGVIISNDQLQRICHQIDAFPRSLQWTLQIGDGWGIARNGASLRLLQDGNIPVSSGTPTTMQVIEWSIANGNDAGEDERTLVIRLDNVLDAEAAFTISATGEVKNGLFTPSWKSNPMKLKDFLRGQKVSLHLRDHVPVILHGENLVAVHVNDRWEVDSAFQRGSVGITLSLPTM